MFEFSNNSPWYLRTEANQVKRQGIKVISVAQGTSPGNGFVQLPSPVDFTTQNASVETGYQGKQGNLAANLLYSKFDNGNDLLRFDFEGPLFGIKLQGAFVFSGKGSFE